jgi:hypothetical protein
MFDAALYHRLTLQGCTQAQIAALFGTSIRRVRLELNAANRPREDRSTAAGIPRHSGRVTLASFTMYVRQMEQRR